MCLDMYQIGIFMNKSYLKIFPLDWGMNPNKKSEKVVT